MLAVVASPHHLGMLIMLLIVLAIIGLNILVHLFLCLRHSTADFDDLADVCTRPVLHYVLPLLLIALLTAIDPTHILITIWYYLAAVLVCIKILLHLARKLGRR